MNKTFHAAIFIFTIIAIYIFQTGCSSGKNNSFQRNYHSLATRYNTLYNAEAILNEQLDLLRQSIDIDSAHLLYLTPEDAPRPQTSAFSPVIEKTSNAIALHSIPKRPKRKPGHSGDEEYRQWLLRSEYNPIIQNAWMLLGKAYFLNADYRQAASTFNHIAEKFHWLPQTVAEANLRHARTLIAMNELFDAEFILSGISENQLHNKKTRLLYLQTSASLHIKQKQFEEAKKEISLAIPLAKGYEKRTMKQVLVKLKDSPQTNVAHTTITPRTKLTTRGFSRMYLGNGSSEFSKAENGPQTLSANAEDAHMFVFMFNNCSPRTVNRFLVEVANHNFEIFPNRDFDLEITSIGDSAAIVVCGLKNRNESEIYERTVKEAALTQKTNAEIICFSISTPDFKLIREERVPISGYLNFISENKKITLP